MCQCWDRGVAVGMMAFLRRNAKFIVPLSETLTPEGKGIDKEDQWRQCRELLERRRDGTEDGRENGGAVPAVAGSLPAEGPAKVGHLARRVQPAVSWQCINHALTL